MLHGRRSASTCGGCSTRVFACVESGLGVQFGPRGYVNGRGFNSMESAETTGYEPITIRPGESAGLYCGTLNSSQVYLVNLTIDVVGGTNYNCAEYIRAIADGCGPIVVRNDSASDVVHLMTIGVQEVGTLDTPYFQLCPVLLDPVSLSDTTKRYAVAKFDSDDAAFPVWYWRMPQRPRQTASRSVISRRDRPQRPRDSTTSALRTSSVPLGVPCFQRWLDLGLPRERWARAA